MKAWVLAIAAVPAIARGESRCLEMPPVLHAVKGAAVVCVDDDKGPCWQLGAKADADTKVVHPPAQPPPKPTLAKGKLCIGRTCKSVGKNLAAAIKAGLAADSKRGAGSNVTATDDLSRIAIEADDAITSHVWSVAKDAEIAVAAPKRASGTPKLKFVRIYHNAVLGKWICYDAPCGMLESLIGAKGEVIGETWPAGKEIVLDKNRVAVLSEYPNTGTFTVVDTRTGAHRTLVTDKDQPDRLAIARLSPTSVAIGWATDQKQYKLARVTAKPNADPVLDGDVRADPICAIK